MLVPERLELLDIRNQIVHCHYLLGLPGNPHALTVWPAVAGLSQVMLNIEGGELGGWCSMWGDGPDGGGAGSERQPHGPSLPACRGTTPVAHLFLSQLSTPKDFSLLADLSC